MMKIRIVKQYGCDFCKKRGLSSGHMRKHILHCTLNPNRICRMCKIMQEVQPNLQDLIKILPNPKEYEVIQEGIINGFLPYIFLGNKLSDAIDLIMPELRKLSNNCPVCMMAAFRQKKIPVTMVKNFDFKKEVEDIFAEINDLAREEEQQMYAVYGY